MIDSSANTLFQLIRSAMGNKVEYNLPADTDWKELIGLSFEQGVAAIAVDGLQKFYEANPRLELTLDSPELEPLKYEWFGATFQAEGDYGKTVEAVEELAQKYPIVVLKGLAVARKYPVPSHRASVDLDVYINDDDNRLLQNVKVIRDDYKHTGFMYKGVMVEYHKSLIGWKSLSSGRYIEKTLREALGTPDGIYPNDYFNALFLTVHSYTHFMLEDGISLKHIIDWYLCFNEDDGSTGSPTNENLREWVLATVETFGMREFAESMTRVAEYVCKDPSTALTKTDSRMLDDIIALGKKKRFKNGHLNMACNILFRNGWKFRAFDKESNLACLTRCGWNAIMKTRTI